MFVKPLPHDYSKRPLYKDNLFAQLNNTCTHRIKTENTKIFKIIPITLSAKMAFKYSCALLTLFLLILFLNINFDLLSITSQIIFLMIPEKVKWIQSFIHFKICFIGIGEP